MRQKSNRKCTAGFKHGGTRVFTRYLLSFSALQITIFVVLGVVLTYFVADLWINDQQLALYNYAGYIADSSALAMDGANEGENASNDLIYSITNYAQLNEVDIFITDRAGRVIYCEDMAVDRLQYTGECTCGEHQSLHIPGEIFTAVQADGQLSVLGSMTGADNRDTFIAACAVLDGSTPVPVGYAFIVQPLTMGIRPYLMKFLRLYVMIGAVMMLVVGLIIYFSTYRMTAPIKIMSDATKHYADGDFSYKTDRRRMGNVREYNELADALNLMADSLQRMENSRSAFLANVSHELKTPMTTIGGFVDGIIDGTIPRDQEEYYLGIVSEEVKRLSRLVASMLNMTRMEAGELSLELRRFDLTEMLIRIFLSFDGAITEKNITVRGLDKLPRLSLLGDRDMINQVFYNLADNAVKFTEQGGDIAIFGAMEGDRITVTIRNTGKMLSAEDLEHVFDRFYKGDKSRGLDTKSTGLGLFLVKNIVEMHNGEITAHNIDDRYTQFEVVLPLDPKGKENG